MHQKSVPLLLFLLLSCLLFGGGCALRLYEVPLDAAKVDRRFEEYLQRGELKIVEARKEEDREALRLGEKRLVRRDLQDFIDNEWLPGWEYIQGLDIKTFATDGMGVDGLLVPEDKLVHYDGEVPVFATQSGGVMPGPKLSFIHLSDVQLHDERVYMFDKELTKFFDQFVQSFEHAPDMVLYDYSYYLTLIGTMRRLYDGLPEERRPSFMVHTGDAIDMGVVSELYEFIYITNKLNIPWYNVVGNHDYPVYGNINAQEVGVVKPNMGFQTVNTRYNLINMHGKGYDVDPLVYFSPDNAPDDDTLLTGSVYNGFDRRGKGFLEEGPLKDRRNKPCKKCPGYYHFEALEPRDGEPGVLCVVLDTTTRHFKFARGTVYRQEEVMDPADEEKRRLLELDWLKGVLEEYAQQGNWMVLVFGHHPLGKDSFFDDSYKKLEELFFEPKYNVVAYFCGHTHRHEVLYHANPEERETFGFWEIVAGAVFEYPKRGSLVTTRCTESGQWEIVLQGFWPYFVEGLGADAPELLKNAKKCLDASKEDEEGRKLVKRFNELDQKHRDVILRFAYPEAK